jgi:CheY-like chemotaxis protein
LLILLLVYRDDIRRAIPRLSGVEAFGLKVSLIDWSAWSKRASKGREIPITAGELKAAIARAESAGRVYQGARILWADDHPENNLWERRALTALGADVTVVLSNEEARDRICRGDFDVLISDLQRDNDEKPREVAEVVSGGSNPPVVIYYSGKPPDSPTPEAFRATTRPDELINLITDALERRASAQDSN